MVPIDWVLARIRTERPSWERPSVTLTYAQSLDGSISAKRGRPLTLSGPDSARLTHQLRARHDAILVGIGTVLADDPRLDVRLVEGKNPQPVVLDSRLRTPASANLLKGLAGPDRPPIIVTIESAPVRRRAILEAAGAMVLCLPASEDGRVSLPDLLKHLKERGIESLMVEGGARVITSFLRERLVDFYVLTIAPVIVGGLRSVEELSGREPGNLIQVFPRFLDGEWARIGIDLVFCGKPTWPARMDSSTDR
jgi:3,4-dihydroxy 2-butanone 4-phosphate synthase/GTP cyclohydrolase II